MLIFISIEIDSNALLAYLAESKMNPKLSKNSIEENWYKLQTTKGKIMIQTKK